MIDKGTLLVLPKPCTITPSSTLGATAASNMLHDEKALVWRSQGKTEAYLVLTQTGPWDVIALLGTNLVASSSVRIRAAATLAGLTSSPALDQTIPAFSGTPKASGPMVLFRLAVPVTHAFVRIDFIANDVADDFVQVSNLVLGSAVEWDGVDTGAEVTYDNQGASYLRKFQTKPTWKITLSGITRAAYFAQWDDFCLAASERGGFLFVPVYNDDYMQKRSAYVSMIGSPKVIYNTANDLTLELTVATIQ